MPPRGKIEKSGEREKKSGGGAERRDFFGLSSPPLRTSAQRQREKGGSDASLLNDVGLHSTSATFKPYAVSLLFGDYSGTSLRRGALRTMRSQGVDRDKCADTTGHSTMVPGGHSGGTVPIKSALHSYDEIDPNDVVHGTMALCGWKPPIGILTHAPKVATLEALEGTVPMASLEHLARNLFRLDSTVTPSLQPGKRLAPLVRTMLAHCIMYFTRRCWIPTAAKTLLCSACPSSW